jgi:peptidoglycan/xylan/chitin deacetylase (PgdA/CDA1 family)
MFIAILFLTMLFTGLVNVSATAQTSSGFINSSTPTAASVNAPVTAAGVTSTSSAKKYVVFRDDDVGFGNLSALEAVDQVHIEENVPVTLAVIPHPNPCGTGNELLQDTPVTNYLLSIVNNPLFEFAQHGYNHYDYAQNGPPSCSASSAGAGVPQVVGPAGPYYEVGESPGPGGQLTGATPASEFAGRPYADQYNAIKQGRDDMIQALGVAPTTFIPPFDSGDGNTLKAATALGFTLYNTGPGDFNVNDASLDGIMVQASSIGLGWNNDTAWKTGMQSVTQATDAALNKATAGETIVVAYHFWTFEAPGGSPDPAWLALFKQYIDHLKSRGDVIFTTLGGQPLMNPSPAPAVCSQGGNSLDVFAQGAYHALWNKDYQPGSGWSSWEYLGGYLTSSPAVTSPANGTIGVFVRGRDGALYEDTYAGGHWAWSKIGGQLLAGTSPAAYNWGSAQTGVFVTGTNNALYQWTGSTGWVKLGGYLTSSPAATSPANGVIDVFVRGSDGALYSKQLSGGVWGSWKKIGGQLASGTGPAVCAQNANSLDVFVQGTNGALYHKSYTGTSWSSWQNLGGYLTSSSAATSPANGVIDVFVRGSNGVFWESSYNNGSYAWASIGSTWS